MWKPFRKRFLGDWKIKKLNVSRFFVHSSLTEIPCSFYHFPSESFVKTVKPDDLYVRMLLAVVEIVEKLRQI